MANENPPDNLLRDNWKVIGVVILAPFMTQMDSTIVNVSLATMREDLHAPISSAQWIISAYLLALALMLPLHGWLVDRLGTKKLYLACFSTFTLASLLCGLARTMPELIAARVIQGMAGGLLAPLAQLMLARIAGKHMARIIGVASAPVLLAPLLGPLLAGMILKYAGWPWLFFVNLPVGILAIIFAFRFIPDEESITRKHAFDFWGFIALSPGLSLLLYGFERASHGEGWQPLALGLILLSVFVVRNIRRKDSALIDFGLFRVRIFSVATVTQFLANGIMYAGQFLLPLFLINGAGLAPDKASWILSTMGLGMLTVYPLMGRITDKFGCRPVVVSGILLNFLGTAPFLWMSLYGFSVPLAIVGMVLRGVGQGATGIPSLSAAYASVPRERLSAATTAVNIVQRLGGPIVTTAVAIVFSLSESLPKSSHFHSFVIAFMTLIVFQLCIFGIAVKLPLRISPQ